MSKNIAIGIVIAIILVVTYFIFSNATGKINTTPQEIEVLQQDKQSSTAPQMVNKQASFAIFTNGTFRIFTATMYHNLSQDVYIEASNPNIIKIRKVGITWHDFFSTLPFNLTRDCLTTGTKGTFCTNKSKTLKFYLNGVIENDLLSKEIKNGDRALITFGSESEKQIQGQINKLNTLSNF